MTSNGHERAKPLRTGDPEELGEYRIVGRLGRGGMGTVYLGRDASDRQVAVKLIHPDLGDDEAFRRRFAREVEAARRVARFSTAGVLDARFESDPLYIVSEYVPGPNLSETVQADGPMHGGTLESLAMGVAAALTAIHGAGVIHRDLKPANVLLSSVGPKVIDFGIARAMDDDSAVTRSSQLMGTPAYLAPELITGEEVTSASDIFSWGCLVAFAGTGRAPFDAATVPAVLHQISSGAPNLDGLDPRLDALVRQALEKEPGNRPTAQRLLNNLVGQEDPAASTVDRTVSRSWTPPATARPGAGSGGAVAGAAGVAAGATLGAADPPEANGAPTESVSARGDAPTGDISAPTANLEGGATHAMDPGVTGAHPPPTRPMDHGAPSGPRVPGYGPPSGPAPAPGHGTQPRGAPPHGQPGYGAPPGPGTPPGPGGAAPTGGPSPRQPGGRRRTALIAGATTLVVLVGVAVFGATRLLGGPSFPEGSLIYSDEFGDMESGWDAPYDEEFDPTDDFNLTGYTGDETYAMRATPDDTRLTSAAAFEGDTPDRLGISVEATPHDGPEYGEMGMLCFINDDEETAYSITARLDGTGVEIRRDAGEGGSATLGEANDISGFVTQEDADEPTNTLRATCDLDEDEDTVTIRAWVNESFVLEAVDEDPLPGGETGLMVRRDGGGSGGDVLVHFDNYRLTEIDNGESGE
ncbi:serine/threonine-protein kinase [Halostreptopolyspora alba]|uniref:Serine/threonine protein kinase n=1 Tax=Halostreptopolyspora alba TaxID=2487137 RepID=A0A3N0DYT1_9ACTN|nr:serine/threonine protein kinase [Nocardiopsaceae bacterium YIM 96095]